MAHEEFKKKGGTFGGNLQGGGSEQAEQRFHLDNAIAEEKANIENQALASQLERMRSGGSSEGDGFTLPLTNTMNMGGTIALDRLYGKSEPGGIHQILGTSNPSAGANTNLFTVLGKHTARVSVLWAANRRLIDAKIRIGFDIGGGNTNIVPDDAWLYYNVKVPGESTLVLDAATGLWLTARTDVVVRTDVGGISFGASGVEYATV